MTEDGHRTTAQRVSDTRRRLAEDADVWVASAGAGDPWLVPLSFHWTGEVVLLATLRRSVTYRNVAAGGGLRLALGPTRDVVVIDGEVDLPERVTDQQADAVAEVTGYDPRREPETAYIRVRPHRVQAWRNVSELRGRTVMRDGTWATGDAG